MFPSYLSFPFADDQRVFWEHIWGLQPGVRPAAFIAIWARGWAKSTSAELATVVVGALEKRRYALYVSGTQEQADDHVANVAAMLESSRFGVFYPSVSSRKISKYGHSKGWRRNRLRTASGFTVDSIGLDTAARGIKMDEDRPDFLIFDDLDQEHDERRTIEKKVKSLTHKILPSGATDLAVVGIQNLVSQLGIFTQLSDGSADFLHDRIVSGPIPAVVGLEYEFVDKKDEEGKEYVITDGTPTWVGMDLETCEEFINDWGLTAFLNEAQHKTQPPPGGMFNHILPHVPHVRYDDIKWDLVRKVCWVDPAVSDKDRSDCHAISIWGLGKDNRFYALYSWERRTSPRDALRRAILQAVEYGAESVGVETDQGGDTWLDVYSNAHEDAEAELGRPIRLPFKMARAGSIGSKTHRASQLLFSYERDEVRHVLGTHDSLELALDRFPRTKPLDLVDASFWSWKDLDEFRVKGDQPDVVETSDEFRVIISNF